MADICNFRTDGIVHDQDAMIFCSANKIGADNRAPRLKFHGFGFSIDLVAGGAALTGSVSDLAR